jgi:hypothetical protein
MKQGIWLSGLFFCSFAAGQDELSHLKPGAQYYGPDLNSNAIREYLTGTARAYFEGEGRGFVVTDGYRPGDAPHSQRGAIDVRSSDIDTAQRQNEAKGLSEKYGAANDVLVSVEEGFGNPSMPSMPLFLLPPVKLMTYYSNGKVLYYELRPFGATHTHIQVRATVSPTQFMTNHGLHATAGDAKMEKTLLGEGYSTGMRLGLNLPATSVLNPLNNVELRPIAQAFMAFHGNSGFGAAGGPSGLGFLWSGSFPDIQWGSGGGWSFRLSGPGGGFGVSFGGSGEE